MFARFVVRSGPNAGRQHFLAGGQAVLGRAPQCQIVLADQRASRQHAQIRLQDGTWIIEDLSSTNGTFVNGQRLEPRVPRVLHPSDEVRLADTILTFQVEQEEEAVSSSGLPYLASTGTASRRRLHPLVLVMVAAAIVLLLGLVVLVVVLLTSESEPASTLPTAPQTEAAVAPVLTPEPSPSQPPAEGTPAADLSRTALPPEVEATPKDTALSKEALAWLQALEGKLFAAGELILKFKGGLSDQEMQAFLAEQGLQQKDEIQALGLQLVSVKDGSASEALAALADHPLLAFVDLNAVVRGLNEPNDAHWSRQWNMPIIEAPQGWDLSTGSGETIVAIVDSGVDLNHPDLRDKIVAGYDFVEYDATPQDDYGHGTHVAGIAAAFGNNGEGVAGVSWGSRIMPVRVLGAQNQGSDFGVIEGMVWATDQGARVMNLSLGSPMPGMLANQGIPGGDALREAVNYAHSHNVLVVAASGNEYQEGNPPSYPAAYAHVLAVGATNDEDSHAYYSNAGSYVDVTAPGGETSGPDDPHGVFSTLPNYEVELTRSGFPTGYGALQGTSMAAPHVAGLAALVWSMNPGLSNDQVQAIIEGTADDRGAPGWDGCFGTGRINVNQALQAASAGQIPPGGPREHRRVTPLFCADFTVVPEATFVIPAPTIEWSWGP